MRVIFFGTPDFAATCLEALVQHGPDSNVEVVAVVTATDKPGKRGSELVPTAVKVIAQKYDLPILQPEKLKDPVFLDQLASYKADLQVIVAFRMLPEVVWNMPPLGSLNVHGSLLPAYRGAAPINWALMNGETETGLTTFLLKHEIDTGDILLTDRIPILPEDDFGTLYGIMAKAGAELLLRTLDGLERGTLTPVPQGEPVPLTADGLDRTRAPKLNADNTRLDFAKPARQVVNQVRGLAPVPAGYLYWGTEKVKVFKTQAVASDLLNLPAESDHQPGTVHRQGQQLFVRAQDAWVELLEVQFPGKKRLPVSEVLKGLRDIVAQVNV